MTPPGNVAELLRDAARREPDKTALVFGATSAEGSITFAELDAEVDRVASGLAGLGVVAGDRVAIAMHNIPHFAYAYLGVLRAGAVAVPLNILLTKTEIETILRDSEPKLLLAAPPALESAGAAASSVPSIERVISVAEWAELARAGGPPTEVTTGGADLAVLSYTSGTTGEPKGVMLSHDNLLANLKQQMDIPEHHVEPNDVLFLALPLFHIFGLNVTLGLLMLNATTGVMVERFEPIASLRLIQEQKVTVLFGAPPMYIAWVNTPGGDQYDLSSVRIAISGAAPLAEEVLTGFKATFGVDIYEGYGLTETAPTLTTNRMGEGARAGSVGRPLPGVELRIVDEKGEDVEIGDPGEVWARGPNVFQGYWRREEDNERAFVDGWFRTGDIAVRDEEGYIYLVDRKRDLIIVSGFNVFPSEVEAALVEHPKVAEAAVVGVPHPYTGEAVKAYVVPVEGETLVEDELVFHASARLARFKCPESIEIVAELPHLVTGKVLRRALRT